ncbi:MAG TPA: alpha/beta fold hydrolase [SAR86 cluster bacterium]|nr:alpha/beta fold hydrolase [SAR86 cluster bacterium]HJM15518.1 alpha/beta fold hydrolase [SAR86 cluster bacterium]HJM59610.1 alpha/beta fold hydrolase [SAR86 cluster bacterium]
MSKFLLVLFFTMSSLVSSNTDLYTVKSEDIEVWSDGTRMQGNLFIPQDDSVEKWPTILLAHGWGGLKDHLNKSYAPKFASAGYIVMTFDYRGWGESDSRLVVYDDMPKPGRFSNKVSVTATAIRDLVDPLDQYEDIQASLYFLEGDPRVDGGKIAIWGSSFGGGHAIMVGANDPRIKVIVAQVASMGAGMEVFASELKKRLIAQARKEEDPVPQGIDKQPGLSGTPHYGRMSLYQPITRAKDIKVPTLIVDAENEELFNRLENGRAVYNQIKDKVPSKYVTFPGKHYDIYSTNFEASTDIQIEWFNQHLK